MKMNLPNKLTVLRIVLVPVFFLLCMWDFYGHLLAACAVFGAAALTDLLDGKIARKRGLITNLGKFLDPIADKVLTTAAFIALLMEIGGGHRWLWAWCLMLIMAREFVVATVRMMAAGGGEVVAADIWGKVKTVMQFIVVIFMLVALDAVTLIGVIFKADVTLWHTLVVWIGDLMMVLTTVATVISGARYTLNNWRYIKED